MCSWNCTGAGEPGDRGPRSLLAAAGRDAPVDRCAAAEIGAAGVGRGGVD